MKEKLKKQAVYGVIFNSAHTEVLLVKRRDIPVWVLPGGGKDPHETAEEGACREVFEETGFQVQVKRKIALYSPVNLLTQPSHVFECTITGGSAHPSSETQDIRFFPLDALPRLLPPPYPGWIADAALNKQEVIHKKIEGVSYLVLLKLLLLHPLLVGRYLLTKLGIHLNS
ncbi:MAG: hypothetical protein RLZZ453_1293 [Chlamydiota bacterium]|jgi:8-oxo-dGTP pyrophosphatase MutT (NUDIX family)